MYLGVLSKAGLVAVFVFAISPAFAQEFASERFSDCKKWPDAATNLAGTSIKDAFECLFAKIDSLEEEIRPFKNVRGAVIAFDRDRTNEAVCPKGWSYFHPAGGRFIVGAGEHENGLHEYPSFVEDNKQAVGGEQTIILTEAQMPSHRHRISTNFGTNDIHDGLAGGSYAPNQDLGIIQDFRIIEDKPNWPHVLPNVLEASGGNQPHNNMPPYIALYYCKKD